MSRRFVVFLVVFTVVAAVFFGPFLVRNRFLVANTPVPPPGTSVTPVVLEPGSRACAEQVTFDERGDLVQLVPLQEGRPGPPLALTLDAPGYRARATVPGGYRGNAPVRVRIDPPAKAVIGTLCVRNSGRATTQLVGTNEFRTGGRSAVKLDGQPIPTDFALAFYESEPGRVALILPRIVQRAAQNHGALVGPWLVWPLLIAFVIGIPLLCARAIAED